jgi:FKBP-type peptidyl-prolyl cis-trans isomerase
MKIGGRFRLTVPPDMAYGDRGFNGPSAFVPPGAWVISEVQLLEIK